jgi:hypothetical protein
MHERTTSDRLSGQTRQNSVDDCIGPMIAWDLVTTFLAADFSQEERHLRRLSKVAALENKPTSDIGDKAPAVPA